MPLSKLSTLMMWRSTLIALLVLAILADTQALVSWGNPSFATISSGRVNYLVSKNGTHISISNDLSSSEVCELKYNDAHIGRIQTAWIKPQLILLLYRHNLTMVRMLQLDTVLCLYEPLPNLQTSVESNAEPQMILLNNTVDIFLRGHENCSPCRFDVNGYRLGVTGQLAQSELSLFQSFIVKEFVPKEQVRNYALVGNFASGTSVLKILDQNFSTTKEKFFCHRIEALAAHSGPNESWIGITFAGLGNPYERVLAIFTSDLQLVFKRRVKHDAGYKVYNTLLAINSTGHSFVNYILSSTVSPLSSYAIYNPKGVLSKYGNIFSISSNTKYDWQFFLDESSHGENFGSAIHSYSSSGTQSILYWF